ncbi:MAG: hypothetical protein Q8876_05650 [Bacillota bacterium]|nr:hypothetical protein [Bacillota bacterium]
MFSRFRSHVLRTTVSYALLFSFCLTTTVPANALNPFEEAQKAYELKCLCERAEQLVHCKTNKSLVKKFKALTKDITSVTGKKFSLKNILADTKAEIKRNNIKISSKEFNEATKNIRIIWNGGADAHAGIQNEKPEKLITGIVLVSIGTVLCAASVYINSSGCLWFSRTIVTIGMNSIYNSIMAEREKNQENADRGVA